MTAVSPQVVVVGSINADLTVHVSRHPQPGETLLGSGGLVSPGGKGANQAVSAVLQGARVAFVGGVGDDAYAPAATAIMRSSGVDMAGVTTVPGASGLAVITVSEDGENTIIVIPGANSHLDATYVSSYEELITSAEIVLLQGEIPASGIERAIELAQRPVINLAPVITIDRRSLLKADPLIANEHEAALILEQLGQTIPQESEIPQALLDVGFNSVVLTLGARGAVVADGQGISKIPTPAVDPVDTTGAGDAFAGALVARLVAGDDLRAAATQAVAVAADSTTREGAQTSYTRT